jgi:hypothetical protein
MRTIYYTTATKAMAMAIASLSFVLWTPIAKASEDNDVSAVIIDDRFEIIPSPIDASDSPLLLLDALSSERDTEKPERESPIDNAALRGSTNLDLPPIPPIHPVHTGSVQYSSVMDPSEVVTYRRDIHAPCDFGMLVFNVGPSKDELPYHYDLYGDAYLWSDNGGLCILYPTYTGYQISTDGPFWRPGYDPTTVRFGDLVAGPRHMHKISSRIMGPPGGGAKKHAAEIDPARAGDYVIMGKHDFYGINYYKQLKNYVNSWGATGPNDEESAEMDDLGWVVSDATTNATTTTKTNYVSEMS